MDREPTAQPNFSLPELILLTVASWGFIVAMIWAAIQVPV